MNNYPPGVTGTEPQIALDLWDVLDIEQPETSAFHLWAAAQDQGGE